MADLTHSAVRKTPDCRLLSQRSRDAFFSFILCIDYLCYVSIMIEICVKHHRCIHPYFTLILYRVNTQTLVTFQGFIYVTVLMIMAYIMKTYH